MWKKKIALGWLEFFFLLKECSLYFCSSTLALHFLAVYSTTGVQLLLGLFSTHSHGWNPVSRCNIGQRFIFFPVKGITKYFNQKSVLEIEVTSQIGSIKLSLLFIITVSYVSVEFSPEGVFNELAAGKVERFSQLLRWNEVLLQCLCLIYFYLPLPLLKCALLLQPLRNVFCTFPHSRVSL